MLETLGVDLALPAAGIERCIKEAGIAFMFAPNFHPAMKHIVPVRKARSGSGSGQGQGQG